MIFKTKIMYCCFTFQVTESRLNNIYLEMQKIKSENLDISKIFNGSVTKHQFDSLYRLLENSKTYKNIDLLYTDYKEKYYGNLPQDVLQEMLLMIYNSKTGLIKFKNN